MGVDGRCYSQDGRRIGHWVNVLVLNLSNNTCQHKHRLEHQPDGNNITICHKEQQSKMAITPAKTENISCKPNGNMAITSAKNIKLPKIIGSNICQNQNKNIVSP